MNLPFPSYSQHSWHDVYSSDDFFDDLVVQNVCRSVHICKVFLPCGIYNDVSFRRGA